MSALAQLEAQYSWLKEAIRASLGSEAMVMFTDLGTIQTIVVISHGRSSAFALQGAIKQRHPAQNMMTSTLTFCLADEPEGVRASCLETILAPFRDVVPAQAGPLHPRLAN